MIRRLLSHRGHDECESCSASFLLKFYAEILRDYPKRHSIFSYHYVHILLFPALVADSGFSYLGIF